MNVKVSRLLPVIGIDRNLKACLADDFLLKYIIKKKLNKFIYYMTLFQRRLLAKQLMELGKSRGERIKIKC